MELAEIYKNYKEKIKKHREVYNEQIKEIDNNVSDLYIKKENTTNIFNKEQIQFLDEFNEEEKQFHIRKELELKELLAKEEEFRMSNINNTNQSIKE